MAGKRVPMVGRGNDDRIDLACLEHLAVVLVRAALELGGHRLGRRQEAIGDRHDLRVTGQRGQLTRSAAGTDEADADAVVGSGMLSRSQDPVRDDVGCGDRRCDAGRLLEKSSTSHGRSRRGHTAARNF